MQLGAWRRAALAFRVALPKSSRFSSRTSRQNTEVLHGSVWYRSTPGGGGRIRTIRVICCSQGMVRITPPID